MKKNLTHTDAHAHTGARPSIILNVLIACEESQAECAAFRALGHNAFSCDIQPVRRGGNPSWHIHEDVSPYLAGQTKFTTQDGTEYSLPRWDLIIAHPPCTYFSKVGSPWLYKNPSIWVFTTQGWKHVNFSRWMNLLWARDFFNGCLNAHAQFVAVENPIPMEIAALPRPTTYADPSWFGVKYTKKTCYWLKNLPPLMPTVVNPTTKCYATYSRGKYRSRTFPAMAEAIAQQWSNFIIDEYLAERCHSEEQFL